LYRSSLLLGLFLASSPILDLTGLGGPARSLSSRRHRSRDHGEYWALSPRRGDNPSRATPITTSACNNSNNNNNNKGEIMKCNYNDDIEGEFILLVPSVKVQ
jgi:hypothetical protein